MYWGVKVSITWHVTERKFGEFQDSKDNTVIRAMEQWEEKQI